MAPVPVGGGQALIAGYRVLRRLASSDRADLYVGVAPALSTSPESEVHGKVPGFSGTSVVLKVFRPGTEDLAVEREVRALTALTPGRLTMLVDVGTLPDGRTCLVLEQLTGGALSGFLKNRRHLPPGEAVTILAPVAAALAELQTIGLVHPAVSLSTILFDSFGRPVLTGLGELQELPDAGRGRTEALAMMHDRLAQVVRAVLDQVDPVVPAQAALRDLDRWCAGRSARPAATAPSQLEHFLFAWAEAEPVTFSRTGDDGRGPQTAGDWLRRPVPDDPSGRAAALTVRVASGEVRAQRLLGTLASRTSAGVRRLRGVHPAGGLKAVLSRRFRVRRGALLLAAIFAVASTGLALNARGPGGSAVTAGVRPETSTAPAGATALPSSDPAKSDASGAGDRDADRAATASDDPATAVPALLRLRAWCLDEVSVVCLDAVHQSQSAALTADSHTLRMMHQGGDAPEAEDVSLWSAVLVERTGDVALVSLQAHDLERQPASVLVVKGEAGWRIREIFDY
ncbi:protein kinase [Cryobacterium sp. TMT3-29-2]|uniref:protein kinase n=1 Tax=Cryobacterium sp. TMT3-29-2 TaxID=2555867 RepID=UPI0014322BC6|nr:protein kinase [Cryobacterium sp. TMT3-29-2]